MLDPKQTTFKEDAIVCLDANNLKIYSCNTDTLENPSKCTLADFFTNNIPSVWDLTCITTLNLEFCDISDVPRDIKKLANLRQLSLAYNKLVEVPSCLYSSLSTLEILDLSNNFIKRFDVEPACWNSLINLKIANNKISNFPHWILSLRCPKLVEVDYSYNYLTKINLLHQVVLKKLVMRNSQMNDLDFPFLKQLRTLEYLDISNDNSEKNENHFKEINNLFVRTKFKNLKVLKMNNVLISIIPKDLFWLSSLTELYLVYCDLNWIPESVQYLTNLKTLDVSNNAICSIPIQVSTLPNLQHLIAPFNFIASIAYIENELTTLDLYHNELEHNSEYFSKAEFIDLEMNYFETALIRNARLYKSRKNGLRTKLSCKERHDGHRTKPFEDNALESDDGFEEEDYNTPGEYWDSDLEDEQWDYDQSSNFRHCNQKNPDITSSDEEWTGNEEAEGGWTEKGTKLYKPWYDADEDWVFTDAE